MGALIWIACLIAALHQHQSAPRERITLLPSQDGKPSAVVVTGRQGETVLDQPYRSAVIDRAGALAAAPTEPAEVRQRYAATLAALPQSAAVFTVYFVTGTETLVPESAERLPQIKAALAQRPVPEVLVIGHTDRVDTTAVNDALSLKRAQAVRQWLVEGGVAEENIVVTGRGEREPAVATADGQAEPRNRRVEIRVR